MNAVSTGFIGMFYYRVSNHDEAEDITQEAFVRAWKAIDKYKRTGAPFVSWIITIAGNLIIDHYRKQKKVEFTDEIEKYPKKTWGTRFRVRKTGRN